MARRHGLIAALTWAALVAAPAQATPVFTLYGAGPERLRPGVLAAEASLDSMPIELAAAADGRVAFTHAGGVWTSRGARIVRVPAPPGAGELAFSPSGDLLVATCPVGPAQLYRVAPDRAPVLVAGRARGSRSAGDGGPAATATFECLAGFGFAADGAILLADRAAHRVRRIGPDSIVSTVAGNGRSPVIRPYRAAGGDDGPASAAVLSSPTDVAPLEGGGFAVLDEGKVRIVGPDGVIRAANAPVAVAIAPDPAGLLILEADGHVWRRSADGALTEIAALGRERLGITPYVPVAYDPFATNEVIASDVVPSSDGGLLVSADFAIDYVPPPVPTRLALAILPATRVPATGLTVSVTTTAPAQLRIGVWRRGTRAALVTASVPRGDAAIAVPGLRPGLYSLHIQAADHDEIAAARADVLVGGRLPVAYARGFIRSRLDLMEVVDDAEHVNLMCRRMGSGRVDCAMRTRRGNCAGIVSLRVEADGTLSVWQYEGGRRCRFDPDAGEPTRRGPVASGQLAR